mmetsp:Transcript_25608/g.47266  ORF Transcript_25608/g.47266 Transcript_25608/m.47266 type:complete len:110 (-) Transcript_25608:23-352(-)
MLSLGSLPISQGFHRPCHALFTMHPAPCLSIAVQLMIGSDVTLVWYLEDQPRLAQKAKAKLTVTVMILEAKQHQQVKANAPRSDQVVSLHPRHDLKWCRVLMMIESVTW